MRTNLPLKTLFIICAFITTSCAQVNNNDNNDHNTSDNTNDHNSKVSTSTLPDYIFTPSTNTTSQIEQTLSLAKAQKKQALFVLGAQWCHDSKALAKTFSTSAMQKILNENYQVLFVDAGYFEKGFDLVETFNLPAYYGTPTVMIVDPTSKKVRNKASMKKWLNAYKVPLNEYVEYFSRFADNNNKAIDVSESMQAYLSTINDFEKQQAVRLKAAYNVVGPLFKQYMESNNKKASSEFSDKWQQVSDFRHRIPSDIQTLIEQATSNVKTGSSAPLTLPTYPAFTWE